MATKHLKFKLVTSVSRETKLAELALRHELQAQGYVEIQDVRITQNEIDVKDYSLEDRLINWGRVVTRQRAPSNVTAPWAADYVANRNSAQFQCAIAQGLIQRPSVVQQIDKQSISEAQMADAWAIESAWSHIGDFDMKQALKMKYVLRLRESEIRRRLRLRGSRGVQLIMWRAKFSLQQILARSKNGDIIRTNNLTAASRA